MPAPWGSNSSSTGKVQTDIDADATTVTDQANKQRRSISNGLGQLIRIDEPTAGGLGPVTSPYQATSYVYDTLNNLTTVNQGAQTRSFVYDSLSRLKSANNPESGTISYLYDNNGNLTRKTARGIQTNYIYDALNRFTQRSLKLNYTYGTTNNNGNVLSQTITVPGAANPIIQNYAYDMLNRLRSATERVNSQVQWKQTFGFDRYGNRNITAGTGVTNLTFSATNNRSRRAVILTIPLATQSPTHAEKLLPTTPKTNRQLSATAP